MRAALFSIVTVLTLAAFGTAEAQLRLRPEPRFSAEELDTGLSTRFDRAPEDRPSDPLFFEHAFAESSIRERIDDGRFTVQVPFLDVELTTRNQSYYLREGMKQRLEGLYFTRIIDDRTTVYAGAWLTKYSERFMPRMEKELNVGVSVTRKISWSGR